MLELFAKIGDELQEAYRKVDYDERRFCELSMEAVLEHDVPKHFDFVQLVHELIGRERTLETAASEFGQPPVTVYRGRNFYIEILFWLEGTTTVHQHGFSGAFQVLRGSSLHTTYRWKAKATVNSHLELGTVQRIESQHLRQGEAHRIAAGEPFIHSLFHLEHPSISMVVRTDVEEGKSPQFAYLLPHVRYDPFFKDFDLAVKKRLLHMMRSLNHEALRDTLRRFAARATFYDLFRVLVELEPATGPYTWLLAGVDKRFPEWTPLVADTMREQHRQRLLLRQRAQITDEEQRFLLGLLMNLSDRRDFIRLMRARFPKQDVAEVVTRLVNAVTARDGADRLMAVKLEEDTRDLLHGMLLGRRKQALVHHLSKSFELSAKQSKLVLKFDELVSESPLFSALF